MSPRPVLRRTLCLLVSATFCLAVTVGLAQTQEPSGQEAKPQESANKQEQQPGNKHKAKHKRRKRGLRPEIFERPNRHQWQKPDLVIQHMGVKPGQVIADIGAGSGYFSRRFAKVVGTEGFVFACDIDVNMLKYIQEDCKKRGIDNVVTVLAAEWSPMLPPKSVDIVFLCNTNHHIKNRVEYYRRLKKVFKPGGRLVIVDLFKDKKFGPPREHKLARKVVLKEMKEAGYKLIEDNVELLPYQYYLVFEPICD